MEAITGNGSGKINPQANKTLDTSQSNKEPKRKKGLAFVFLVVIVFLISTNSYSAYKYYQLQSQARVEDSNNLVEQPVTPQLKRQEESDLAVAQDNPEYSVIKLENGNSLVVSKYNYQLTLPPKWEVYETSASNYEFNAVYCGREGGLCPESGYKEAVYLHFKHTSDNTIYISLEDWIKTTKPQYSLNEHDHPDGATSLFQDTQIVEDDFEAIIRNNPSNSTGNIYIVLDTRLIEVDYNILGYEDLGELKYNEIKEIVRTLSVSDSP